MTQNLFKKLPFSGLILIGIFIVTTLVPLFDYISAKEVTEMPKWPEYFQSGLRVPNDLETGTIINDQDDPENATNKSFCPDGNCDGNVKHSDLASSSSQGKIEAIPDSLEIFSTTSELTPIQQNTLISEVPMPSPGTVKDLAKISEGMPIPFSDDPITRERENELIATGLLSRHAEITESIFLMEQQLKQAQLIIGLMEILGPDIPIEISPGVFKSFRNTPAGNKIASEMAVGTLESRAEIFDLEMKVLTAKQKIESAMNPLHGLVDIQAINEIEASNPIPDHEPILREIIGGAGNLRAIFSIGDEIVSLTKGEILPSGAKIIQITQEFVALDKVGQPMMFRIK